jgi:hypothetical protein
MKALFTKIILSAVTAAIFTTNANAKIWRVNNNGNNPVPAIVSDFPSSTTLQQVNDNALVSSGDTIHLEQSPTSYGNCIFNKRLIVIGAGYFLNQNPNTQVNNSYGSKTGDLTFYNAASASSFVYGCEVGNVNMGVNNLTIARCYFPSVSCLIGNNSTGNIDGMSLRQCVFGGSIGAVFIIRNNTGTGLVTNMNVYGNIIVPTFYGINLDNRVSGIFKNNVVSVFYNPIQVQGFYVVNNLTYSSQGAYPNSFTNCNVEYNAGTQPSHFVTGMAGSGTTYGTGNTTKTLAQIAFLGGSSSDGFYQLGAGTAVAGIGKDGNDLGAFSGDYPYKLSGIAPVPNIYALTIAPITAGAATISVTVSAKGNN